MAHTITNQTKWNINSGLNTLFWFHVWDGDSPKRIEHHRFYSLSDNNSYPSKTLGTLIKKADELDTIRWNPNSCWRFLYKILEVVVDYYRYSIKPIGHDAHLDNSRSSLDCLPDCRSMVIEGNVTLMLVVAWRIWTLRNQVVSCARSISIPVLVDSIQGHVN
ncbi:unnamed protein product [Citrullus colocynthis]|uniref:Uncharacterized protein n=1 Tax=Citrullus colocynthis TaxID=252529 RepID=A0ABP0YYX0_9ROSI